MVKVLEKDVLVARQEREETFNGSYTFYSEKFTEIYKDIIIFTIVSILTDYSGLSSSQMPTG